MVHQDNRSAILLERNGKASSSKRTKHINIWYFFVKDRIKNGKVSVLWCPTGEMVGDFATKPLQGALFKRFRDLLMGVTATPKTATDPVKKRSKGGSGGKCKTKGTQG